MKEQHLGLVVAHQSSSVFLSTCWILSAVLSVFLRPQALTVYRFVHEMRLEISVTQVSKISHLIVYIINRSSERSGGMRESIGELFMLEARRTEFAS